MAPWSLIEQLSQVLCCQPNELYIKLHDSKTREQAIAFLKLVHLQTNYLRVNQAVRFSALTFTSVRNLMAFRGFLGITVAQFYYVKHRVILAFMDLPCIVQSNGQGFEYFPLELLTVVPDQNETPPLLPTVTSVGVEEEEKENTPPPPQEIRLNRRK